MSWIVFTQEYAEIEGRSSPMFSREHALCFACDEIARGVTVVRIEGYGQEIDAEEIDAWGRHTTGYRISLKS